MAHVIQRKLWILIVETLNIEILQAKSITHLVIRMLESQTQALDSLFCLLNGSQVGPKLLLIVYWRSKKLKHKKFFCSDKMFHPCIYNPTNGKDEMDRMKMKG